MSSKTARGQREHYRLLNMVDGGALTDLAKKGTLPYAEELYNPGNFFRIVYHVVFDKRDLSVLIRNKTIKLVLLKRTRHVPKIDFLINLLYYIIQVIQLPRKYAIDGIRARGPYLAGLLAIIAGKANGIPVVVSLGGDHRLAQQMEGRYFLRNRLLSWKWEEFVLRKAQKVYCPNEFTRNYAKALGVDSARISKVPLLLPAYVFHQRGRPSEVLGTLGWRGQPIVLAVSRLTPYKQVDILVEAIPLILREVPSARFVFVGDGPMMESLVARCAELGIASSVRFVGFKPNEQVVHYLAAASVVWVPMSGFGILEAAAAGKPIVAFDVEWHKEFVESNVNGMLVRNRDLPHLAETVVQLLKNPGRAQRFGKNARAKLLRYYDRRTSIDIETRTYDALIRRYRKA